MIHDSSLLKVVDGDDGSEKREEGRFLLSKLKFVFSRSLPRRLYRLSP